MPKYNGLGPVSLLIDAGPVWVVCVSCVPVWLSLDRITAAAGVISCLAGCVVPVTPFVVRLAVYAASGLYDGAQGQ